MLSSSSDSFSCTVVKVAVNTRLLQKGKLDGIGWFTCETMKRISRSQPGHEFIFLFDRAHDAEFLFSGNITPVVIFPQARHPLLWYWWFERSLPAFFRKYKPDVFLSPDGFLSLSSDIPSVCVIHDINFEHRPKDLPFWTGRYHRYFFPKFAERADRIVTVSDYSRADIASSYGIPPEKITVAHNGANPVYTPLSPPEQMKVREELTMGLEYFVYVGSLYPRKNIPSLLLAFERFRQISGKHMKMVLVGGTVSLTSPVRKVLSSMRYTKDVVFTGRLLPEELRRVYGAATALTFVPFFEGFGIPLIEAMNCDTAVLASNVTSLPEVGGDAVHYADPRDVASICAGMLRIADDLKYRRELIARGRERCRQFSWDITADMVWKSIAEVTGKI